MAYRIIARRKTRLSLDIQSESPFKFATFQTMDGLFLPPVRQSDLPENAVECVKTAPESRQNETSNATMAGCGQLYQISFLFVFKDFLNRT
ncbi:MAG TPA: hypothetical protein DDW73_13195 [Rhizobium sp.]|nr:hypothetical protein [Rhizobium sp.]